MGYTFMTTGDERTLKRWSSSNGFVISSTYARTGTYSFYAYGAYYYLRKSITPTATPPYMRACFLNPSAGAVTFQFREASIVHFYLELNWDSGQIRVMCSSGVVLGVLQANLTAKVWYCVEVRGSISDTTGTCVIRLNGEERLNLANVDTRNGGTGLCDNVLVVYTTNVPIYVDDVAFRDDTWPGVKGIYLVPVTAAAGVQEWSASAGTPAACVDEVPATFTDYIYRDSLETGDQHEFAQAGIPDLNYLEIGGIGVVAYGKLASAGSGALKATYYDPANAGGDASAAVALDTSGVYVDDYWLTDANGAPFTRASIGQLYLGVQVGAAP